MSRRPLPILGSLFILLVVWGASCGKKSPGEPSCAFTVSASTFTIGSSGGPASLAVSTADGCAWTARADSAWLSITSGASGTGSGSVNFAAAANSTTAVRMGTLTVAGHAVSVTQEAAPAACTYSVSPESASFTAEGAPGTVTVTASSGCPWTATSAAAWLTITGGAPGTGNGTVTYAVARNDGGASRETTIEIAGRSVAIAQAGQAAACVSAVSPDSASYSNDGGTGRVEVTAPGSCVWTAASAASWLAITGGESGTGSGSVSYTVAPNPEPAGRETVIDVGGRTVTVAQSGNLSACEYSVAPTSFSPCMSAPFELTATITTGAMCPWTASSNVPWIAVTRGASGAGSGHIGFTVSSNYDAPRSDQVLVRWPTPTAGQNLLVAQAGCRYGVSKSAIAFSASGGPGSFDVLQQSDPIECGGPLQNACVWTATTDASWIVITSHQPKVGDDTVGFAVAANPNPSPRTALIVVRDKTVQITQAAGPATAAH